MDLSPEVIAALRAKAAQGSSQPVSSSSVSPDILAALKAKASEGQPQMSGLDKAQGFVNAGLKGLTFGMGDNVASAGNALIDKLVWGKEGSIADLYNARQGQMESNVEGVRESNPVAAYGLEIGTSLLSPAAGVKAVNFATKGLKPGSILARTLANPITKAAGAGAIESGIYAVGEGQDVGDAIKFGGGFGAGMGAAGQLAKGTGKFLKGYGKNRKMSALGIDDTAIRQSRDSTAGNRFFNRNKKTRLEAAYDDLDAAKEFGLVGKSKSGNSKSIDPDELYFRSMSEATRLEDELVDVLKKADAAKDQPIRIDFEDIKSRILRSDEIVDEDIPKLNKKIQELEELWKSGNQGFIKAQNDKIRRYKRAKFHKRGTQNKTPIDELVNQELSIALKQSIEDGVDDLVRKGKLKPEVSNYVKQQNNQIGNWLELKDLAFQKNAGNKTNETSNRLARLFSTTGIGALGGAGVGYYGQQTDNPFLMGVGYGAAGVNAANLFPSARYRIGNISQAAGGAAEATGNFLQNQALKIPQRFEEKESSSALTNQTSPTMTKNAVSVPSKNPIPQQYQNQSVNQQPISNIDRNAPKLEQKAEIKQFISQQDPLVQAMIKVESGGNPQAKSGAGARGLMQVMPFWDDKLGINNPFDPVENVNAGIEIFNQELERFGDPVLALAAYNAGSPAVNRAIKRAGSRQWSQVKKYLPKETAAYPAKILAEYRRIA